MPRHSAGLLIYRRTDAQPEVLLVRPGGPYWKRKTLGSWQIPKGEIEPSEDAAAAAVRETQEELGIAIFGPLVALATIRQAGGKIVDTFAVEQAVDASAIRSNSFTLEWPPKSGRLQDFPEVEEGRWMSLTDARTLMLPSQRPLLDALTSHLAASSGT